MSCSVSTSHVGRKCDHTCNAYGTLCDRSSTAARHVLASTRWWIDCPARAFFERVWTAACQEYPCHTSNRCCDITADTLCWLQPTSGWMQYPFKLWYYHFDGHENCPEPHLSGQLDDPVGSRLPRHYRHLHLNRLVVRRWRRLRSISMLLHYSLSARILKLCPFLHTNHVFDNRVRFNAACAAGAANICVANYCHTSMPPSDWSTFMNRSGQFALPGPRQMPSE